MYTKMTNYTYADTAIVQNYDVAAFLSDTVAHRYLVLIQIKLKFDGLKK